MFLLACYAASICDGKDMVTTVEEGQKGLVWSFKRHLCITPLYH